MPGQVSFESGVVMEIQDMSECLGNLIFMVNIIPAEAQIILLCLNIDAF